MSRDITRKQCGGRELGASNNFDLFSQHRDIIIEHLQKTMCHTKRVILVFRSDEQVTLSQQDNHWRVSIQDAQMTVVGRSSYERRGPIEGCYRR